MIRSLSSIPIVPVLGAAILACLVTLTGCGGEGGGSGDFSQEFEQPEVSTPAAGDPSADVEPINPRERRNQP